MEIEDKVGFIERQTTYTKEEIERKLEEYNNDINKIIDEYLTIEKKEVNKKDVNQEIYKEIRNLMDTTIRGYEERKEKEENNNS